MTPGLLGPEDSCDQKVSFTVNFYVTYFGFIELAGEFFQKYHPMSPPILASGKKITLVVVSNILYFHPYMGK